MATVLVLGAGLCCPPLVHYLDKKGYIVRVGSRTLDKAQSIVQGTQAAVALKINVEDEGDLLTLEEEIKKSNAVVSMLPYLFHVVPAKLAIKYGKHFLTTSYVSDAMKQLDEDAKAKGVVLINECGVDPGMDHMSAMRIIHNVQAKGGKIVSFRSYCGGLPAKDCNNNPFGYKFSWAPRGVLLAARNNATFLENGKQVVIPSKELFSKGYHKINVPGSGEYEAYPNRDSVSYISTYKVEGISTMIRGTLRNEGWCKVMQAMVDLDLLSLDDTPSLAGKKYSSLLAGALGSDDVKTTLAQNLGVGVDHQIIQQFEFLGLFSDEPIPSGVTTKLDAISSAMLKRMQYAPGEKDLIVMKHEFVVAYGDKKEGINSTLVLEGVPNGPTSMSTTVATPVAIATHLVLSGQFVTPGIQTPIIPELYNPILDELERLGMKFEETFEAVV